MILPLPFIIAGSIVGLGALAYGGAALYMYKKQRDFLFNRDAGLQSLPSLREAGLDNYGFTSERVEMEKGIRTTVWHRRADPGKPTILYLHGNAYTLAWRSGRFREMAKAGFGVYAFAYRGYPGSDGSPTETNILADAVRHCDRLREMVGKDSKIVAYGESLGTGVAAAVTARREIAALVLEAPYTAIVDLVQEQYPWLPVAALLKDTFLTRERIKKTAEPVLILHGEKDDYIKPAHGRKLFKLAMEPKQLEIIPGGGHSDLWDHGSWSKVEQWLQEMVQ